MKTSLHVSTSLFFAVFCLVLKSLAEPPAPAALQTPADAPATAVRNEMPQPSPGARAEPLPPPVTFLGVEANPVDDALGTQLGLSPNTGLKITSVIPDGPAAGHLKLYDVLTKFRDQILIEPRQLGVLVRASKDGEEVEITYLRAGKEAIATIKLAQRANVKELMSIDDSSIDKRLNDVAEEVRRRREARAVAAAGITSVSSTLPKRDAIQTKFGNYQELSLTDELGSVTLRTDKKSRMLTEKNPEGKILFFGPVETDEERAKLPATLLERLRKIEASSSYKSIQEFEARLERKSSEPNKPVSTP